MQWIPRSLRLHITPVCFDFATQDCNRSRWVSLGAILTFRKLGTYNVTVLQTLLFYLCSRRDFKYHGDAIALVERYCTDGWSKLLSSLSLLQVHFYYTFFHYQFFCCFRAAHCPSAAPFAFIVMLGFCNTILPCSLASFLFWRPHFCSSHIISSKLPNSYMHIHSSSYKFSTTAQRSNNSHLQCWKTETQMHIKIMKKAASIGWSK